MGHIYTSVDQLIGGTPLLELSRLEREEGLEARILAKLECFNPAGSTKDRAARAMLDDAEARGLLRPGSVVIEPTSGNTGIGLASVAAARASRVGYFAYRMGVTRFTRASVHWAARRTENSSS